MLLSSYYHYGIQEHGYHQHLTYKHLNIKMVYLRLMFVILYGIRFVGLSYGLCWGGGGKRDDYLIINGYGGLRTFGIFIFRSLGFVSCGIRCCCWMVRNVHGSLYGILRCLVGMCIILGLCSLDMFSISCF